MSCILLLLLYIKCTKNNKTKKLLISQSTPINKVHASYLYTMLVIYICQLLIQSYTPAMVYDTNVPIYLICTNSQKPTAAKLELFKIPFFTKKQVHQRTNQLPKIKAPAKKLPSYGPKHFLIFKQINIYQKSSMY